MLLDELATIEELELLTTTLLEEELTTDDTELDELVTPSHAPLSAQCCQRPELVVGLLFCVQ